MPPPPLENYNLQLKMSEKCAWDPQTDVLLDICFYENVRIFMITAKSNLGSIYIKYTV
jgi:hypothetical protein